MGLDRKKLALIHIIKKDLGLSDEQYRHILFKACGVNSAKDLDESGFRRLMRFFVRTEYYRSGPDAVTLRQKMFIKYLADRLGWSQGHLQNFLNKYYHRKELGALTRIQAAKAIESLKNISLRNINKKKDDYNV